MKLEPISNVLKVHRGTGKQREPEEVGGVMLPVSAEPPLPLL